MNEEIVLVTHADTDTGFGIARELLAAGVCVAVTARHPSALTRILLGHSADRLFAVAADIDTQRTDVLQRVHTRFGHPVTRVIDGRYGAVPRSRSLQIAS